MLTVKRSVISCSVIIEGQPFSLSELKPVVVLTSSPATLLLGMELYFFPHIESARILPFTKKRSISVDALQIEKYIDNIVIPIARYHDIETHGLNITEKNVPVKLFSHSKMPHTTDKHCNLSSAMETRHLHQIVLMK